MNKRPARSQSGEDAYRQRKRQRIEDSSNAPSHAEEIFSAKQLSSLVSFKQDDAPQSRY
ncbi:hypothetical protein LTS18_002764, partial [Coniosporium uncinatum]